jgi:hypothetical protein
MVGDGGDRKKRKKRKKRKRWYVEVEKWYEVVQVHGKVSAVR